MCTPSLEEVKKLASEGNLIPVWREVVADLETPVSAFLKVSRGNYSFLLESVEGGQRTARYSFIGTEPDKIITSNQNDKIGPLQKIKAELRKYRQVQIFGLPRLSGGAVGYLSYETAQRFEDLPSPQIDPLGLPEAIFMLSNTMLIFDHVTHKIIILSHARVEDDVETAYRNAALKIDELEARLKGPLPPSADPHTVQTAGDIRSNVSKEEFEKSVAKAREYITAGEAIQVVLSQRLAVPTSVAPFDIYRALRTINPSPYMFFLRLAGFPHAGRLTGNPGQGGRRSVMTRPLAGTRPRGRMRSRMKPLGRNCCYDEKERAEHIMLVDLGSNDIGRVSEPGTVKVSDLMDVERYSHVMHMVTHVQGKLSQDMTVFDALQACFPAGTVSGAPKIRAMEIIAEFEPEKRGPYAGACGYFSFYGNMDMAIAIRTIVVKAPGLPIFSPAAELSTTAFRNANIEETLNKAWRCLKPSSRPKECRKE